jgi:hypothetical protein
MDALKPVRGMTDFVVVDTACCPLMVEICNGLIPNPRNPSACFHDDVGGPCPNRPYITSVLHATQNGFYEISHTQFVVQKLARNVLVKYKWY